MFKKHHQYIVGRHVTIPTNHKPLLRILAEEMGIPQLAGLRLKRKQGHLAVMLIASVIS